jgi:hypothetical protein
MDNMIADRPKRIINIPRKQFLRKWRDQCVPNLAIFSEVIIVDMAKGVSIHDASSPSFGDRKIIVAQAFW